MEEDISIRLQTHVLEIDYLKMEIVVGSARKSHGIRITLPLFPTRDIQIKIEFTEKICSRELGCKGRREIKIYLTVGMRGVTRKLREQRVLVEDIARTLKCDTDIWWMFRRSKRPK